jgi:hypothetical protein
MVRLLTFLLLFITYTVSAQDVELRLKKLPLRNAYINTMPKSKAHCMRSNLEGLLIYSLTDSCFANAAGVVINTLELGEGSYVVLVRATDRMIYAYAGLRNLAVQKNGIVAQGTFVGLVNSPESEDHFELTYIVCDQKGRYLSREKHLENVRRQDILVSCFEPAL